MATNLNALIHSFVASNYPEKLVKLYGDGLLGGFLTEKVRFFESMRLDLRRQAIPNYIIDELILKAFAEEMGPSRFNYMIHMLESYFEDFYYLTRSSGVITYEIINLIEIVQPHFEKFGFTSEDDDNRQLKYAILGTITKYLEIDRLQF